MLAASYVFYGWWDWRFCFLLAGSTVVNQVFAVAVHRTATGRPPASCCSPRTSSSTSASSSFFKYYDFFATPFQNGSRTSACASRALLGAILPVGISFFTFQALSYVIDVYRGDFQPARSRSSPSTSRSSRTSSPGRSCARASSCRSSHAARPAPRRRQPRLLPDRQRAVHEGRDRRPTSRTRSSTTSSARPSGTRRSTRSSASTPTRCRSSPTSAATPTSRSASRCCSASASRRTSTTRTRAASRATSGAAGT